MILVLSFFVILFFIIGLLFSKVKIKVKKMHFRILRNDLIKNDYCINVGIYLYGKIKVFGINLRNNEFKIMGRRINYERIIKSKLYTRLMKPELKEIDKKILFQKIKEIYIKFEKFNLDLSLGTDNTILTSFLIFTISTVLSIVIKKGVSRYNPRKHSFIITPMYENYNLLNLDLDCVISLKTLNIIKTLAYINKNYKVKEKMEKDSLINKKKHYPGYV